MPRNEDILPEEDELMDRCLEFTGLITHRSMKEERDALFQFIAQASRLRAEKEMYLYGYTKYPVLPMVVPLVRLINQSMIYSGEQELFVNKVLEVLKDKKTVSIGGSRYA